jgi:hypothetical protein
LALQFVLLNVLRVDVQNKRDLNTLLRLATAEADTVYKKMMNEVRCNKDNKSGMCCLATKGALIRIMDNTKTKYNLSSCTTICSSTIHSRYKRNNVNPACAQGTQSPMAAVEPYLALVILQLANMRCPIIATTGLHLANSMIQGTALAKTQRMEFEARCTNEVEALS